MPDFLRLHAAGFAHLLPIIPHDAAISPRSRALQGREDMLGKIPGKRLEDGWCGLAGWESLEAEAADLEAWQAMGAGIGMRCQGVVAVDIDVTEAALVRLIQLEAITWLGFAPKRTGNAPKCLLLFRTGEDLPTKRVLSFQDYRGQRQAVELLGARQQFVVSGIHPKTGRPYAWDADLEAEGYAGLPAVRLSDLEAFLAACVATLSTFDCEQLTTTSGRGHDERAPERLRAPDLALLAETVRAIPNEEETPRETMVAMAHAIRAAADEDPDAGLDIFREWADRWPAGQRDGEVEHVYWSARPGQTGAQWLYDQARLAGVATVEADFGEVAANDDTAPLADPEGDSSLWGRYCYVNQQKRFIELRSGLRLDKEQFNDRHRTPDSKKKPADIFLEHRQPYSFADETDYAPGQPGGAFRCAETGKVLFNTWRPGPAQSGAWAEGPTGEAAIAPWLRLAEHVIADPWERGVVMDWMAHLLQRPGIKPSWHPLLGSTHHGTGKDSLVAPLVAGLGHNACTIKASDLASDWTWWAADVQLVLVSEMHSFERREVMNKMKTYMAAPPDTIGINIKGVPQYDVRNTFGMVMFSNNPDAAAIENGDRRFFVSWSEAEPLPASFYEEYHRWLEAGGAAAVCRYLLARDLSGFNAKGKAPDTEAKEAMRQAALGQVDGLLAMGIEDERGPFARDLVTLEEILAWLKPQVRAMPGPHKMASHLKLAGCESLGRARIGEERERLYACRRGAMYVGLPAAQLRNLLIEQREQTSGAAADFGEVSDDESGGVV